MSILNLKPKEMAFIKDIDGGIQIKKRLLELGLVKGSQIQLVKNDIGPVVISMAGHKLALGRGLAGKIIVEQ